MIQGPVAYPSPNGKPNNGKGVIRFRFVDRFAPLRQ
jgi:hypothetical protein